MGNKVCAECKLDQAVSFFYRDKSRPGGYARVCKACDRAHLQKRYYANPEESKARSRQWGANNKERRAEYDKLKYAANRDRMQAQAKAWHLANPERVAKHKRDWQERNPEHAAKLKKTWQEQNPERYASIKRANEAKRRARKASVLVIDFSDAQLEARLAYYGHRCWICRTGEYEELDHVKPLSKGGAHMLSNLRPACQSCNRTKHANWPFSTAA